MKIHVHHALGKDEAKRRLDQHLTEIAALAAHERAILGFATFDATHGSWEGNRKTFRVLIPPEIRLEGTIEVADNAVSVRFTIVLEGLLGFGARLFRGLIEEGVEPMRDALSRAIEKRLHDNEAG